MAAATVSPTRMVLSVDELDAVFSDITPVPQSDGPTAACRIDYTADFVKAYDRLRGLWQAGEVSARALPLTALCLTLNPANYTVWHYRRKCLQKVLLPSSNNNDDDDEAGAFVENKHDRIKAEFEWVSQLGGENPKNYQIWYHRRALLEGFIQVKKEGSGDTDDDDGERAVFLDYCASELAYVRTVLSVDGKNYHAWSHRQAILRAARSEELFERELEFARECIDDDVRNNSAWNQRWFVAHRGRRDSILDASLAAAEADYALSQARLDPYNESCWRYAVAVWKEQVRAATEDDERIAALLTSALERIWQVQEEVLLKKGSGGHGTDTSCPALMMAALDVLEWLGDEASLRRAMELTEELGTKCDVIRFKFWKMRNQTLQKALEKIGSSSKTAA